jgi:hypothetical protein
MRCRLSSAYGAIGNLNRFRHGRKANGCAEKILKTANPAVGGEANGDHGIVNRRIGFSFAVFIQVDKVELLVQLVLGGRWKLAADGFLFASPKVATKKKKIAGSPKDSTNSQEPMDMGTLSKNVVSATMVVMMPG